MLENGATIVVDIGKTLGKVSLWSSDGRMLERQSRPNAKPVEQGIARLDAAGIAEWMPQALSAYAGEAIRVIVPVAHGAAFAALKGGTLAFAPFDYEAEPGESLLETYRDQRQAFAETGSPALPGGLNLGLQLHWAQNLYPNEMHDAVLLPWAQYWAWYLTGKAVSEVTSLGCHSDLWLPEQRRFSSLAEARGWASQFAPIVQADAVVGGLRDDLAAVTGLAAGTPVLAGLHDSNAALFAARGFPDIEAKEATILSTGTWFIGMRLPKEKVSTQMLAEARDCLVNVDVEGRMVPSARFMGGREIETLIGIDTRQVDIRPDQPALLSAVADIVEKGAMVLPSAVRGSGPFPDKEGEWVDEPADAIARRAAACLYAALMTDQMLRLIGSRGSLLVEGRFGEAEVFVRGLASLRPEMAIHVANEHNDVALGALRLIDPKLRPASSLRRVEPLDNDLDGYRELWLARMEKRG